MTDKERNLPDCGSCSVKQYCGTVVSSVRLCRSIHEQKQQDEDGTETIQTDTDGKSG